MNISLVYDFPELVKWESDWLQYLLRDFDVQLIFDPDHRVVADRVILAPSSSTPDQAVRLRKHLQEFKRSGLKVGLFHLSDEFGSTPVDLYDYPDFVFRNYYWRAMQRRRNCRYFALGYKSGFAQFLSDKPIGQRRYTWSFAGQLKSNRSTMMEQATTLPGGYHHLTTQWDDPAGLNNEQYAMLLSDTVFALCPRGNKSVDCFRVYEALEAGAIPIVEDRSTAGSIVDALRPGGRGSISTLHPRDWLPNLKTHGLGSYWTAAYGPDFPCPRLNHWQNLPALIKSLDPETTSAKIQQWWQDYKSNLAQVISQTLKQTFLT